jgi:hypothetical protein
MTPRRAAAVGIFFLVDAVIYFVAPNFLGGHVDFAGITMLIALAAAMSIMFYVLLAGQSRS